MLNRPFNDLPGQRGMRRGRKLQGHSLPSGQGTGLNRFTAALLLQVFEGRLDHIDLADQVAVLRFGPFLDLNPGVIKSRPVMLNGRGPGLHPFQRGPRFTRFLHLNLTHQGLGFPEFGLVRSLAVKERLNIAGG